MSNKNYTPVIDQKAAKKAAAVAAKKAKKAAAEAKKAAAAVAAAVALVVAFIRFFLYGKKDAALAKWLEAENKPYTYDGTIRIHVSDKNKKLVPNEDTAFIIWNLPAIFTCPFATLHCILACYARKAEYSYHKEVLPARVQNYLMSKRNDFVDIMTRYIMDVAARTKKRYIVIRIHESGDFYCRKYAEKWLQIMRNCSSDKRIKFIAYTKSFPYFDGVKLPKNFSLRASIWDDTSEKQKAIVARNGWNIYTAVEKFEKGDTFSRCRCKDCAGCRHCWQNYKDIRCQIH